MRKALVVILAVLLGVTVLAVGCGGQTKEAKEAMKKADEAWDALNKKLTDMSTQSSGMISKAMMGDTSAITQDPQAITKIGKDLESASAELVKVSNLYKGMESLKGVDDYVAYAEAMVQCIDANILAVRAGGELFAKLAPIIQSGDMTKLAAAITESTAELTKLQELESAATKTLEKAQKIKTDKKLG